jgi:hypothetical protein
VRIGVASPPVLRIRDESPPRDMCLAAVPLRLAALALALGMRLAPAQTPVPTPPPAPPPAPAVPAPQNVAAEAGGFGTSTAPIAALPDPLVLAPSELTFANPLFRPAETPARALDHPSPEDLDTHATVMVAVKLLANGHVAEAVPVEPPLAALVPAVAASAPKWVFTPAKKGGSAVATWATYGVDLAISLDKGAYASFSLTPVGRGDPLPLLAPEAAGDAWITRYPKEPAPPDGTVSIEDVDVLPTPEKTRWSFDSVKTRSRVTALVEVDANGVVERIAPTGRDVEPLVVSWLRRTAGRWRVSPAMAGGKAIASWMTLDATLEYIVSSAKEKGKRSIKKNLRGAPAESL